MTKWLRKSLYRLGQIFTSKRVIKADLVCFAAFLLCVSFAVRQSGRYDRVLTDGVTLESPWMVRTAQEGTAYIVDQEKSRILTVKEGKVTDSMIGGGKKALFSYAETICPDEKGGLYVLDTGWSETGFSLDYEAIVRYSVDGKPEKVCYRKEYKSKEADKHHLFGLNLSGGQLYFVDADETGFALKALDTAAGSIREVFYKELEDAVNLIQDFAVDPDEETVYAVDKRGAILSTDGISQGLKILYQMDKTDHAVLYRASAGESGTVYVTDIKGGRLLQCTMEGVTAVAEGGQMWNVSYADLEAGGGLLSYVADGGVHFYSVEGRASAGTGDTVEEEDTGGIAVFSKSRLYLSRELFFDSVLFLAMLSALWIFVRVCAVVFTFPYNNTQKMGALAVAASVSVSLVLVSGLLNQFREIYRDELLTKLTMTARIIGDGISEEDLDASSMPQAYMGEAYRHLQEKISSVLNRDYDYSEELYCNLLRYDGTEGYAALYLDNSIGTYYPLSGEESEAVASVYENQIPLQSDISQETGTYIYVMTPILNHEGQVFGVVSVGTLDSVVEGKIDAMTHQVLIAMLMSTLVILFMFGEILSFADLREKYRNALRNRGAAFELSAGAELSAAPAVPMHMVRLAVFVTFLSFNMATSFLPVYILRFVREDTVLPAALANSLPMTLNLIFVALTSLICPRLLVRTGFSKLAAASSLIAFMGDCTLALSGGYGGILLGLILNGMGVGLITNSLHSYIASLAEEEKYGDGFSIFNAASLSGINCGMLFGSSLAQMLGQSRVFFVSAGSWLLTAAVFLTAGRRFVMKRRKSPEGSLSDRPQTELDMMGEPGNQEQLQLKEARKQGILHFLATPAVFQFIICIQLPYIITNSFIYYYVPIYGASQGLTENATSLLIITGSLLSVCLSVSLTAYMKKKYQEKAIYLSTAMIFAGLIIFAWKMTLPSLAAALICIGIAGSFGASVRISTFIGMKESEAYGEENATGIYDFMDNLGESGGSLIFAAILSAGFRGGIGVLLGCVGMLNLFYAFTRYKGGGEND